MIRSWWPTAKHKRRKRATDDWPLITNTTGQSGLATKQVRQHPPSCGRPPLTGPQGSDGAPGAMAYAFYRRPLQNGSRSRCGSLLFKPNPIPRSILGPSARRPATHFRRIQESLCNFLPNIADHLRCEKPRAEQPELSISGAFQPAGQRRRRRRVSADRTQWQAARTLTTMAVYQIGRLASFCGS